MLVGKFGVEPPPGLRARRLAFGTRMEREVKNGDPEVLGVQYPPDGLARWSMHSSEKGFALRWYPDDTGTIEVPDGRAMEAVPAVFGSTKV